MSRQPGYTIVDADDEGAEMGYAPSSAPPAADPLAFKSFDAGEAGALGGGIGQQQQQGSGTGRAVGAHGSGSGGGYSTFFNIEYYQYLFDIDATEVVQRCTKALIPVPSKPTGSFVQDVCDGRPDLYGPFWSLTTLAFTLYVCSSLSSSVLAYMADPDARTVQDVGRISLATALVYTYGLGWPAVLWGVVRWFGGAEVEWSLVEAWTVYGYAMFTYIPISLLCMIPIPILRWILVGLGAVSSGYFLFCNVYPVLATLDSKLPRLLIVAIMLAHAAIALTFKVVFFSYGKPIGPADPLTNPLGGAADAVVSAAARAFL